MKVRSMSRHYLTKYPLSLCIVLVVLFLSFFKPPQEIDEIEVPFFDKWAHVCMYFGLSGMLWIEFLRSHRHDDRSLHRAWVGALLCPVIFSGIIELLQAYCTTYRGGDWLDFAANATGALLASLVAYSLKDKIAALGIRKG